MRPIDADEIAKDLKTQMDASNPNWSWANHAVCQDLLEYLDKFPTIEPVKRGKWELDKNRGLVCCTNCGGEKPLKYLDNGTFHKQSFLSPYCPYCGAKMGKEV